MSYMASSKSSNGAGNIRKITRERNGKTYTYWEARYTAGFHPGTGKQIQKSVTGKTQKEVAQKLREVTHDLDIGDYMEPSKMTLGEWLDIWKDSYLLGVKESTQHIYETDIELYIRPALGATHLGDLNMPLIQSFYAGLLHPKRKKVKALSVKSVRCIHGVLHKSLEKAVELKYIRTNPSDGCELPQLLKKEMIPLKKEQVIQFLREIEGHCHEYLYKVALFTGMREAEVLGLTWDCIDFEKGTLVVRQQLCRDRKKGGQYYMSTPKNRKIRYLVLAPAVLDVLRLQREKVRLMQAAAGAAWENNNLVFSNETGGYLSYRTVYDCFKRIVARMGIPGTRFHDLRHTYAVISLESGDDIKTLQQNLGHASAAFTLDVYGHVSDRMKQESAKRMEQYIHQVAVGS